MKDYQFGKDGWMQVHLITKDESKMGHLDNLEIDRFILFLPKT